MLCKWVVRMRSTLNLKCQGKKIINNPTKLFTQIYLPWLCSQHKIYFNIILG